MNGPILNFEVIFYAYQTEFQLNVISPPDFDGDEARQKLNIVNIVKISQISLTALIRPRAALMLGLAPHPGWPLSSDLAPALVITLRPQLRYLACTYWISTG